jgi:hypothetical protein
VRELENALEYAVAARDRRSCLRICRAGSHRRPLPRSRLLARSSRSVRDLPGGPRRTRSTPPASAVPAGADHPPPVGPRPPAPEAAANDLPARRDLRGVVSTTRPAVRRRARHPHQPVRWWRGGHGAGTRPGAVSGRPAAISQQPPLHAPAPIACAVGKRRVPTRSGPGTPGGVLEKNRAKTIDPTTVARW